MADTTKRSRKHPAKSCAFCKDSFIPCGNTQIYCKTCVPNARACQRAAIFGISQPEYNALVEKQGHACGVCKKPFSTMSQRQHRIDHCHMTGRVRGVVCGRCNMLLAALDIKGWVENAQNYVNKVGIDPLWRRHG